MDHKTQEIGCRQLEELLPLLWTRELDGPALKTAEKHLMNCAACREAASTEEELNRMLRQAYAESPGYAADAAEGVRARVRPLLIASRFDWKSIFSIPTFRMAAAAVTLALIAIVGMFFWQNRGVSLYAASHRDHVRCVRNHEHDDWIKAAPAVSAFLQKNLGVDAVPFDYEALGLRFVRTRVCNLGGPRFVHIVFEDASRNEISLYLRKSPQSLLAGPPEFQTAGTGVYIQQIDEFQIAAFETKQRTFVLLSALPRETSRRLAATLIQQL